MRIQIEKLTHVYPGGITALAEIDLALEPGSLTALLGANGAGKTTLGKHLNGLLAPSAGRVLLGEMNTREHPPHILAARAGYMFQNPDDQLFSTTVEEEVAFGPINLGFDPERIACLVKKSLQLTGLMPVKSLNPRDLPANKRRLCSLASVLALDSNCLILDEPTRGLDYADLEIVKKIIHSLNAEAKSILMITHDLDFAVENMVDGIVLKEGRLLTHAPLGRIFADREICRLCGLHPPQMVRLSRCLNLRETALTPDRFVRELAAERSL